jgi:hypothetical protein
MSCNSSSELPTERYTSVDSELIQQWRDAGADVVTRSNSHSDFGIVRLDLAGADCSKIDFRSLNCAVDLGELRIGETAIVEQIEQLMPFPKLKKIVFHGVVLGKKCEYPVLTSPQLSDLVLLTSFAFDLKVLAKCPKIVSLTVRSTQSDITDAHLESLDWVPELIYLDLSHSRISDDSVTQIGKLGQLRTLNVFNTYISELGIAKLRRIYGSKLKIER